ncbi:phosphoglycerate mutase-like protein [Mycena albidolilacea]|uniref:Phosphoglycerate mutase-like protein n=1 Tax=Mycena albidolilacea TaxID=1033008 RepID=A0AAD7AE87_9AGAR|nr:phosphoglycerate mutase-like protein [Mycena albidolilacea]
MVHHGKPELWVTVVFARHADGIESFSSPTTWATFNTFITPLGTEQAFQSGTYLRSEYLDSRSRSFIARISTNIVNVHELLVRADSSGDGTVFQQSVSAVIQGLYPPTRDYKITSANGSTIVGALGGFQYIPIESVEMNEDVSLNGFLSCPNFDLHVANLEQSALFLAKVKEGGPFLRKLHHYLGARPIDFSFMVRAKFKFEPPHSHVGLHRRHNSTFLHQIPPGFVNQARVLADFYDGNAFSDPNPDGIGNVATRVMLPSIFSTLTPRLTRIANSTDPFKLAINGISCKPFISLFNLTEAAKANPEIVGIEHYNSLAALELRNSSTGGELTLWLKFKNSTDEHAFRTLTIFGKTDDPLSEFIAWLTPVAINSTAEWCAACNRIVLRGCDSA